MSSPNPYARLRGLLPTDPLRTGTVTALNADGTSTLQDASGQTFTAQGQDVPVGTPAFVRSGKVQGEAPALPEYTEWV